MTFMTHGTGNCMFVLFPLAQSSMGAIFCVQIDMYTCGSFHYRRETLTSQNLIFLMGSKYAFPLI